MDNEIKLSDEQVKKLWDKWDEDPLSKPKLKDLVIAVFGDGFDGRSLEARTVKKELASKGMKALTADDYEKKTDTIELSEAHKKYIVSNAPMMNSLEMAKVIFANPALSNLSSETRAINEYIKSLNLRVVFSQSDIDNVPTSKYEPPKTFDSVLKRVNSYVTYVTDRTKITPVQRRNLDTLIGYLHTWRFIRQMNSYENEEDRKTCEDAFIRATYDKPDLMQEEIDQYIEYSNQVVQGFNIQRRSIKLQVALETITGNDPETMKISMGLVEAIGKASTEYHQTKAREQKLLDDLKEKRSDRLSKSLKDNSSVLNIIQFWKTEEGRKEMLQHAEKEQEGIAKEVVKLSNLSDLKARILGLVKDDILNG